MPLTTTVYGKAYEYACLISLKDHIQNSTNGVIHVSDSDAYRTAQSAFAQAQNAGEAEKLMYAANAASRIIMRLEPQLEYGNGVLTLAIQTDAQGIAGDVRDVVCIRSENGWEIGLSCKHNHKAAKHSRLSATIDFGNEWFGIPCSAEYFRTVVPLFNELRDMRDIAKARGTEIPLWNSIPDKAERYYIPVLRAFLAELKRIADANNDVPKKLIEYMLGRNDFYKVITDDRHKTTRVEAINLSGTLNRAAGRHKALVDVPRLKLPTCFYHMDMVPGSDNKISVVCDEGWSLTMRIHSASSKVEPSLKFDVQLESVPNSVHAQVEPWFN